MEAGDVLARVTLNAMTDCTFTKMLADRIGTDIGCIAAPVAWQGTNRMAYRGRCRSEVEVCMLSSVWLQDAMSEPAKCN